MGSEMCIRDSYDALFNARRIKVGQVLLTHDDFNQRLRMTNARRTMLNMLQHRVIPIVNENDVVADEEIRADIRLGDNDRLAELLVKLIRADLLIVLTTVDGLRAPSSNGRTRRVPYIEKVDRRMMEWIEAPSGGLSTGGMGSKLKAAHAVARTGCNVVIADGRLPGIIGCIKRGADTGTLVMAD